MQLHQHSQASAGTKRPDPTAAEASSHSIRLSVLRAAMNVLLVQLCVHRHVLRYRGLASSMFGRGHDQLRAPFSHAANQHEHGLGFSRSRRMRSMLRAVRVLPGNSATADRSFFPDRSCSLWRHLRLVRRYADRERLGPP